MQPQPKWLVPAGIAALVLTMLAGTVIWRLRGSSESIGMDNGVSLTVDASTGGDLQHELLPAPPADELPMARALTNTVHLRVDGGQLDEPAKLSFRLPDDIDKQLPEGGTIDDSVFIATKGDEPDAVWQIAGGDYDPDTHTMSVETDHFSFWTVSVTDPEQIKRGLEQEAQTKRRGHVRQYFDELISPDTPKLGCPPLTTMVTLWTHDTFAPPVQACGSFDIATKRYHVEITNPHDFPLKFTLKDYQAHVPETNPDTNFFYDTYRTVVETPDELMLQPHEKRTLSIDQLKQDQGMGVEGTIDVDTVVYDMAAGFVQLFVEPEDFVPGGAVGAYLLNPNFVNCIHRFNEQHQAQLATQPRANWFDILREMSRDCMKLHLALGTPEVAKALERLPGRAGKVGKVVGRRLSLALRVFDLPDMVRLTREWHTSVWGSFYTLLETILSGKNKDYRASVSFGLVQDDLHNVLPAPGEFNGQFTSASGGDPRQTQQGSAGGTASVFSRQCLRPGTPAYDPRWFTNRRTGLASAGNAKYILQKDGKPWAKLSITVAETNHGTGGFTDSGVMRFVAGMQECSNVPSQGGQQSMRKPTTPFTATGPSAEATTWFDVTLNGQPRSVWTAGVFGWAVIFAEFTPVDGAERPLFEMHDDINAVMRYIYERSDGVWGTHLVRP